MTVADDYIEDAPQVYTGAVIPVHVESYGSPARREIPPEFGSCMTWTVPQLGVGVPVQILPRSYRRHLARIIVQDIGAQQNTIAAEGSALNPGAGTNISGTIAAANLPAGEYELNIATYLDGTVAAGDVDNMKINISGGGLQTHLLQPAVANVISYTRIPAVNLNGAQTIQIAATGASSGGGVTYHAIVSATPVGIGGLGGGGTSLILNSKQDPLTSSPPQGLTIVTTPRELIWESQQPCYAIAVGASVLVSVLDEIFGDL